VNEVGRVKEKTLRKIEDFFVKETTLRGNNEIQVSLEELRRETQLSLVTIYKALDNLIELGRLEIVDQGSRRSPKTYRYKQPQQSEISHIQPVAEFAGLSKVLEELLRQLAVKEQVIETFRAKLNEYEALEANVLYRLQVSDDVEVIVRKRS